MALQEKSKWSLANQSINYSKLVFFFKKKKPKQNIHYPWDLE